MASGMDMASRRILGFALGQHHDAQLAYGALVVAPTVRGGQVRGVILHTALGNAVIESWHSTLEFELRSVEHFATRAAAQARVPAWIEDYNKHRRHSALGMMSPVGYEQALKIGKAA